MAPRRVLPLRHHHILIRKISPIIRKQENEKTLYSSAFALTLLLSSCSLIQHTSQGGNDGLQKEATAEAAPAVAEEPVAPNDQLLNVEELVSVFTDAAHMDAAMKKYGYKVQNAYEVFRVAKYDKMYYKNCRLPKKIVDGKFEDYPRALRDGISSYVAVGDGAVMIGVFNDNAYNNLVSQVRATGFQLDMEGNEDIYTNGSYYIACNKTTAPCASRR